MCHAEGEGRPRERAARRERAADSRGAEGGAEATMRTPNPGVPDGGNVRLFFLSLSHFELGVLSLTVKRALIKSGESH